MMRRLLAHVYHLGVVHPYCTVRACFPVWYGVANKEGRMLFEKNKPKLNPVQERIVADLNHSGIAVSSLEDLFPGDSPLVILQEAARRYERDGVVKSGKQFLQFFWDLKPTLDLENPFIKMSLDARVLDTVNSYLHMWAKFYFFSLNRTVPIAAGAKPQQSQRWHRDPEDKKLCKIFLYLNDVDATAGPFMYVKGSHYGGRWRHLFRQRPPHGSRAPYGEVERRVPSGDILAATGRAGTLIFCDTSGLHKGGYATANERIMYTGVFASAASYKYTANPAIVYPDGDKQKNTRVDLSPAARYALVPSRQSMVQKIEKRIKAGGKDEMMPAEG
ncbi:MAG: phytanoyl-CoA dioxygenase family protein [bacterium]|nr:phytanoyl-CoA dioxygenase family protein [bacterium]MDZ4299520.1 phytanoyl-CoA dioxygenase family protein [Candidatus Sungbacteria bacterium]